MNRGLPSRVLRPKGTNKWTIVRSAVSGLYRFGASVSSLLFSKLPDDLCRNAHEDKVCNCSKGAQSMLRHDPLRATEIAAGLFRLGAEPRHIFQFNPGAKIEAD